MAVLEFEKPILELESKIQELKNMAVGNKTSFEPEIKTLTQKLDSMKQDIYSNLSAWQKVQIARHCDRPYTLDYIRLIATEFIELKGDRQFAEDLALVGGMAKINGIKVMVMGHQKGRDTKENVKRNFGCAHPEGYRKAMRLMRMADKFQLPIVIFIDTPGAYPGIGAEERGQAQAIAENIRDMMQIKSPIIITIIGEGGSGGALGVGIGDRVCMLEHSYYSVISPEGCASILWRSSAKAPEAAEALKLTSNYLLKFGIVDEVIEEPLGGIHKDPAKGVEKVKEVIFKYLNELSNVPPEKLLKDRYNKFRKIGAFNIIQEEAVLKPEEPSNKEAVSN